MSSSAQLENTSPSVDLVKDLYKPFPVTPPLTVAEDKIGEIVDAFFKDFKQQVERGDPETSSESFRSLFYEPQAYWRDTLALTWHLRTIEGSTRAGHAFEETSRTRGVHNMVMDRNSIRLIQAQPDLSWVEFMFDFDTSSPYTHCRGKIMLVLVPEVENEKGKPWVPKIWVMSTWLLELQDFPQMEELLRGAPKPLNDASEITTDVLIIGAGNWGLTLASRLKTLGVNFLLVDKNQYIGDNWALRYDNMKFHVPKSFAETPYIPYAAECPDRLTRDDLATQIRRFARLLQLEDSAMLGVSIKSTMYDKEAGRWKVKLSTGQTLLSRHLVLATGLLSSAPYKPVIEATGSYKGIDLHSVEFKNAAMLKAKGVETVMVVGSANTAFDVAQDCIDQDVKVTMIQRSPTLIIPWDYYIPEGLRMYDHMAVEDADAAIFSGPFAVGCQMLSGVHARLAAAEPGRYAALKQAGYQVVDCTEGDLMANLLGRHGGHYVDIGGSALINSTGFRVRSGFAPTAYTSNGLMLKHKDPDVPDEEAASDAVIWCTGYRDLDMRNVAAEILGDGGAEIRDLMEPTWGVSQEGEHRGMYVRQKRLRNFWTVGGGCAHQRWYSKIVAWQIKAELEGILPDPYLA